MTFDPNSESIVPRSTIVIGDGMTAGLRASSVAVGPVDGKLAAIKGTVIRDEIESDGHTGLGIKIVEHSFI